MPAGRTPAEPMHGFFMGFFVSVPFAQQLDCYQVHTHYGMRHLAQIPEAAGRNINCYLKTTCYVISVAA